MDGNGALFGTLQGNTREVLHKFTVDLPKKHGRGGQVRDLSQQENNSDSLAEKFLCV